MPKTQLKQQNSIPGYQYNFGLYRLPVLLLNRILKCLDIESVKVVSLTNRYFRRLTKPYIFKVVDKLNSTQEVPRCQHGYEDCDDICNIVTKYSKYVRVFKHDLKGSGLNISLFENLKEYRETVYRNDHFHKLDPEDWEGYMRLKAYGIIAARKVHLDYSLILPIMKHLNKLTVGGDNSANFPLLKLTSLTVTYLGYIWKYMNGSDFYYIRNNFPNLKVLKLQVMNDIVPPKSLGPKSTFPVFDNIAKLDIRVLNLFHECYFDDYLSNAECWPSLKELTIGGCFGNTYNPKVSYTNLIKLELYNPSICDINELIPFITISKLKIVLSYSIIDYDILWGVFNLLPNLYSLDLKSSFSTTYFDFVTHSQLAIFTLQQIYHFEPTFITFLAQLTNCRKLDITFAINCDYFGQFNWDQNATFPNLIVLNVTNDPVMLDPFIRQLSPLL